MTLQQAQQDLLLIVYSINMQIVSMSDFIQFVWRFQREKQKEKRKIINRKKN